MCWALWLLACCVIGCFDAAFGYWLSAARYHPAIRCSLSSGYPLLAINIKRLSPEEK
jgi:hypothetical protein